MILSLDIETSGLTLDHEILSIGCCTENWRTFYKEIKWDSLLVSPSALQVNNIDLRDNYGKIPLEHALLELNKWLDKEFPNRTKEDIKLLGFNVGSFDLQFMKKSWKQMVFKTGFPFHYRHIELNSCLELLGLDKKSFMDQAKQEMYASTEPSVVQAIKLYDSDHNALFDAIHAMFCWKKLKAISS